MKNRIYVLLLIALMLSGCGSGAESESGVVTAGSVDEILSAETNASAAKTLDGEIKFFPTIDPEYKTGNNEMFDFWFDIPSDWKAVDRSKDGSAYNILSGNYKIEISIYGVLKEKPEEDYYLSLAGSSGSIKDFTYRDGWVGKQIQVTEHKTYYIRVDGDSYMVLLIDASQDPEWKIQNEEKLNTIAVSARTTRESFGSGMEDTSSITPDDLQLGKIKLEMTYDELLEEMDQKPLKEETEEFEGSVAKMLFFSDGTQVYMIDDVVYTINVNNPLYETPRGLKPGDSEERLMDLYGEPSNRKDGVWGFNYNGYELFTVIVSEGKVIEIQIDLGL